MYNWEHPDWPSFTYDESVLLARLEVYEATVAELMSQIRMLPDTNIQEYLLDRLVEEANATSKIEGEVMSRQDLMSSMMNNLTMFGIGMESRDLRARAVSEVIILNRKTFDRPASETMVKSWHELLMGFDNRLKIVGDYRKGTTPMQIISGSAYKPTVHFEAPPSTVVPKEMKDFIAFCNSSQKSGLHPVLKAGISHIWFESIHPFEDGNGRIGRLLLEKLLSQSLGAFIPFSISRAIDDRRKEYYRALRLSSQSLDISPWLDYYCDILIEAVAFGNQMVGFSVKKHRYFKRFENQLGTEDIKAIAKMFEAGPDEFQGGMTTRKYVSINRVSPSTATRSLNRLAGIGALAKHGAGRSVHYTLSLND